MIDKLQPEIIYTNHVGDLNIDHQITHKALVTACRPIPEFSVKEIYAFEVLSSSEWNISGVAVFSPTVFIDITDYIDIGTNDIIYVPENKYYEEILYTITMQYLSYNLSIHKGINPDKPKNLAKVVTVE